MVSFQCAPPLDSVSFNSTASAAGTCAVFGRFAPAKSANVSGRGWRLGGRWLHPPPEKSWWGAWPRWEVGVTQGRGKSRRRAQEFGVRERRREKIVRSEAYPIFRRRSWGKSSALTRAKSGSPMRVARRWFIHHTSGARLRWGLLVNKR